MTEDEHTGIGATLRDARQTQGRSLEEVAQGLRARVGQVRALEEERFSEFGGHVYARGFIKSYARQLGLDPEPLLRTYREDVGGEEAPSTRLLTVGDAPRERVVPPAWIAWVLVAVVVLAGVAFLGTLGDGRTPNQAEPEGPSGPPPAASESDDPTDDDAPDEGETGEEPGEPPDDEPAPEPEPDGVDLLIALEERSWMRIVVDGAVTLERLVEAGETLPFEGENEIEVRYGNAGGARVELNGEDLGLPGGRGDVVDVRYTPDGADVL